MEPCGAAMRVSRRWDHLRHSLFKRTSAPMLIAAPAGTLSSSRYDRAMRLGQGPTTPKSRAAMAARDPFGPVKDGAQSLLF